MVAEALVSLTRIFVPFRARRNASGEAIVRIALLIRWMVILPIPLSGLVARAAFMSDREPESGWIFVALAVAMALGVVAVWWPELRWTREGLFVRPAFRRGQWYGWADFNNLSGTEQSWAVEMDDGRRFKGNKWTSGGGEFLELMQNRAGGSLPEY